MYRFSLVVFLAVTASVCIAQDDLLAMLEDDTSEEEFTTATFKSTRLINGHSVEIRTPKVLEFVIGHRFGAINSGSNDAFGLDNATMRLALEYGLSENLNIGLGRATEAKRIDAFVKYRLLRQSGKVPFTVIGFGSMTFDGDRRADFEFRRHRYNYTGQLLIARKFNSKLSLQIMPTLIQRNLVPTLQDENGLIALGIGGRYKLTNRIAFNAEYYPQLTDFNDERYNAVAFGFDIETGGHVFQLHITNALQMNEPGFIGETVGDFWNGDIHFGFNISRVFTLGGKAGSDW